MGRALKGGRLWKQGERRCHLNPSFFTMFFCPPHGGADRIEGDATGHCPSDRLTPTTPFKKRVSRYANFGCSPVVHPSVVCLMSGDVVMATLVNAFYSPLRSSVVVRPLCLLTTKVKYFPRRPSLARPRVRPARVPVVWAPIMSEREREGGTESGAEASCYKCGCSAQFSSH